MEPDNATAYALSRLAQDIASVIPSIDSETDGQYGPGLGSESEERQVELVLEALRGIDKSYSDADREVAYPSQTATCDIVLDDLIPVEVKLLRYWRANGDPEPNWYKHVFSPFNSNTLLTDAKRLHKSEFKKPGGILGLFYQRASDDPASVEELPEKFEASELAEKVVEDIEYWYDFDAEVCEIAPFNGLQHEVHQQGAVITWAVE
jgi:hypothetical protein